MKHGLLAGLAIVVLGGVVCFQVYERWPRPAKIDEMLGKTTFSPMGAYKDASETPPTTATATLQTPMKKAPDPPRPPLYDRRYDDANFDRLKASSDPHDHWVAYQMAQTCKDETGFRDGEFLRRCYIAPGKWQDEAWRKAAVTEAAQRAELGAWWALIREGPENGGAFALADVFEHRRLISATYPAALARLDVAAVANEVESQAKAGNAAQALTLKVASAAALRRRLGFDYDPNADPRVAELRALVKPADINSAIAQGLEMAQIAKQGELN